MPDAGIPSESSRINAILSTKKRIEPCPICGSKTGLSVKRGRVAAFVATCFKCETPGHEILAALGAEKPHTVLPLPPAPKPKVTPCERIKQVLAGCKPVCPGDPVHQYLEGRSILPDEAEGIPPTLLYHPELPYFGDNKTVTVHPAMVAKLEDVCGNLVTLHRTYLTPDGQKAGVASPKKMMTPVEPGTAAKGTIQLDEPGVVLAIAEGIETALFVRKHCVWTVWACYSAGAISQVEIPDGVRDVMIFPDAGETGTHGAQCAAMRLIQEGFRVKVMAPPGGRDWDDMAEGDAL